MVFLIQNTQNRDTIALQLKLDELILASRGAENRLANIEDAAEDELDQMKREIHEKAARANGRETSG